MSPTGTGGLYGRWIFFWTGALAAALAGGCDGSTVGTDDTGSGWTLEDGGSDGGGDTDPDVTPWDAAVDIGTDPDTGGDDDGGQPNKKYATTFRLENAGEGSLWISPAHGCSTDPPGWLILSRGGGTIRPVGGCTVCHCDDLRDQGGCDVCEPVPCQPPSPREVKPGESVDWTWKGEVWGQYEIDGKSCHEPAIPVRETQFTAEFCWSEKTDASDSESCELVVFEYGDDSVVEIEATPEPKPPPEPVRARFALKNNTDDPVWVKTPTYCHAQDDAWISLKDGSLEVDFETDCTVCRCDQIDEGQGCAVCEKICPDSQVKKLAPGESIRRDWDGIGYRREQRTNATCHVEWVPRDGTKLNAQVCWHEDEPAANRPVGSVCRNVPFVYGKTRTIDEVIDD